MIYIGSYRHLSLCNHLSSPVQVIASSVLNLGPEKISQIEVRCNELMVATVAYNLCYKYIQ